MSELLFRRQWLLRVGGLEVRELRIEFTGKKSLNKDTNKCDIKVYNLAESSRAKITDTSTDAVVLYAGYLSMPNPAEIFVGNIAHAIHYTDGPDRITHIKAVDGMVPQQTNGKPTSSANTTAEAEVKKLLASMSMDEGNFGSFMKGRDPKKLSKFVSTKPPYEAMTELTNSLGGEVTVHDGHPMFVAHGHFASTDFVVLDANSGLIGSPDLGKKNSVVAKSLIQPGFIPGHGVMLRDSKDKYRIESVNYVGDTHGKEWYADLELSLTDGTKVLEEPKPEVKKDAPKP